MLIYLAQNLSPTPLINTSTFPAARYANLGTLINLLGPLLVTGGVLIFGGMLLWGAFTILTAGDDTDKITSAKRTLTWGIVGIVVIISAALIVRIIGSILGVNTLFDL